MNIDSKTESLEESIFKTLSNQKRRDILRFIGEKKQVSFTETKKAVEIEDSYRRQFEIMYPGREIFSRLGEENYQLARQRLDALSR